MKVNIAYMDTIKWDGFIFLISSNKQKTFGNTPSNMCFLFRSAATPPLLLPKRSWFLKTLVDTLLVLPWGVEPGAGRLIEAEEGLPVVDWKLGSSGLQVD